MRYFGMLLINGEPIAQNGDFDNAEDLKGWLGPALEQVLNKEGDLTVWSEPDEPVEG